MTEEDDSKEKKKKNDDIPLDFVTGRAASSSELGDSSNDSWICQECNMRLPTYPDYKRHFSENH